MKLINLNTKYYQVSTLKGAKIWEKYLDKYDDELLIAIHEIVSSDFENTDSDDNKYLLAQNALELFTKIKMEGGNQFRDRINFVQIDYYSHITQYFNSRGLFNSSFHCIGYALSDDYIQEEVVIEDFERIKKIYQSNSPYIQENRDECLINLFSSVFYYSYKTGGHKELASSLYETFISQIITLIKKEPDQKAIYCAGFLVSWANVNGKDPSLINLALENIYDSVFSSEVVKKNICLQFAASNYQRESKNGRDWVKICYVKYYDDLKAHEKLHLLSIYYAETDLDNQILNKIYSAIDEYHNWLAQAKQISNMRYEFNRIIKIIHPLINNLLHKKEHKTLIDLIGKYYNIDQSKLVKNSVMLVVPNHFEGVIYGVDGNQTIFKKDMKNELEKLIENTNIFLNGQLVASDIVSSTVSKARRYGVPEEMYGNKFEIFLDDHYSINEIPGNFISSAHSILSLANYSHPLQNLLYKYHGISKPINLSLQETLNDREIRNIAIWSYGTFTSDLEEKYVREIFLASNKTVRVFKGDENDFKNIYFDSDIDLFWVTTHGEYDDYNPHNSKIKINSVEGILTSTLTGYKSLKNEKRLCVLNLCDSGRVHIDDGILSMGIVADVTNRYQAVIGHLWPIHQSAALVYGILLANSLISKDGFFQAHLNSINILIKGKNSILAELRKIGVNEIVEIVEKCSLDWNNILYWGSPTFFV